MSIKEQAKFNSSLSEKLAVYLNNSSKETKKLPKNSSFVTFSAKNAKLNEQNEKLVSSLTKKGKVIYKAIQTNNSDHPWTFEKVTPNH